MEYFETFQVQRSNLRSFHFGVTMEFSYVVRLSFYPWFCRFCKTMLPLLPCKTMLPPVRTQKYILVF